ncbi:MAG: DNA-3-methyladenine glycosylase [Lautropia sp.]
MPRRGIAPTRSGVALDVAGTAGDGSATRAGRPPPARTLLLRHHAPYDWAAMLDFLAARAVQGMERVVDATYARTVSLDGVHGTLSVGQAGPDALRVTVRFPEPSALPRIAGRLRRLFDLDADPAPIAAHLSRDPRIAPLVARRPGLRVPGAWDGFELAMRAVLGQQVSVAAAVRLAARLLAAHGEPLAHPAAGLTHAFPSPAVIAAADLRWLGMPTSRAATLSAIAASVSSDPALLVGGDGLVASIRRWRAIRGVGEWTAQYIALRQLREPDAFPAGDVALMRALADADGRRPDAAALLAMAERWRPWRGYAAQHLWSDAGRRPA